MGLDEECHYQAKLSGGLGMGLTPRPVEPSANKSRLKTSVAWVVSRKAMGMATAWILRSPVPSIVYLESRLSSQRGYGTLRFNMLVGDSVLSDSFKEQFNFNVCSTPLWTCA